MSNPNNLTNPAVSASGEALTLLIERFNNKVHEQYLKGENLTSHFMVESVTGTNTVSNKYIGETEIQVLSPGKSPDATDTEFDKNALTIDTQILARNTVAQLHDVQNDIAGLNSKLAVNQAKQIKKMEDSMILQQLVLGGTSNTKAIRTTPRVAGHGFSIHIKGQLSSFMSSPQYAMAALELAMEKQIDQEVDTNELRGLLRWDFFNSLRDADRIVDSNYELAQGNTVSGFALKSWNLPVVPSNRFPKLSDNIIDGHHPLSNANNGNRYDVTAPQVNAVAVMFTRDALLVGKTIELYSDIFYFKNNKTWYIDTSIAEGAIPDRWEACAVVTGEADGAAAVDHAAILARANRKVIQTKAIV